MKKHPLKIMGCIFTAIAAIELVVLLGLLCFSQIRQNPEALISLTSVLGVQTLVFGGIGIGFLLHVKKRNKLREELIAGGYYEMAAVVETERVYHVRINGRHPYRVVCRVERSGMLHEYRSGMLMHDPGLETGAPVRVYLDRRDDNRFYVDVESAAPTIIRHG